MIEKPDVTKARLFLVESPFQLISATEAAATIRPDEQAVLVVMRRFSGRDRNDAQIENLIDKFGWEDVRYFDLSGLSMVGRLRQVHHFVRNMISETDGRLSAVFIGEYRWDLMHFFATVLDADESWLLDDGTAILNLCDNLDLGWLASEPSNSFGRVQNWLLSVVSSGKTKPSPDQQRFLFTAFHSFFKDARVVANNFEYLGQYQGTKRGGDVHIVVGQKLSEVGACSRDVEIASLKLIAEDVMSKGDQPVYIPHRDDSPEKLTLIAQMTSMEIRPLTNPLEVEYLLGDERLASASGFFSTALFTLQALMSDLEVTAYKLPEAVLYKERRNSILKFYDALSKTRATMRILESRDIVR